MRSEFVSRRLRGLFAAAALCAAVPAGAAFDARGVLVPLEPVQAIAVGGAFSCAVLGPGKVHCWGNNLFGQLGNGSEFHSVDPLPISGLPDAPITALAAGAQHVCALIQGDIWCWGDNQYGQLGSGQSGGRSFIPVRVKGVNGTATRIAAGDYHSCAVINGGLSCWGNNFYGQLGTGDDTDRLQPVPVQAPSGIVGGLSAGPLHNCAIIENAAWCWGSNQSGQIGTGATGIAEYLAVPVDQLGGGIDEVSAGSAHSCARRGGNVFCWGDNSYGQLGIGNTVPRLTPTVIDNLPPALSIVAGAQHSCARIADGVYCWGDSTYGQLGFPFPTTFPRRIPGLGPTLELATRNTHGCARSADGHAVCWGFNINGQLGDGSADLRTAPVQLAGSYGVPALVVAGLNHTCAAVAGGVQCWGYNGYGNLGRGSQTLNESSPGPAQGIMTRPDSLAAGSNHTCAAVSGALLCWGDNAKGQLGTGQTTQRRVPTPVSGMGSGVSLVSAGDRHTCAIRNGGAWCWGFNANGELGNGTTTDSSVPVAVSGLASGVSWISGGGSHTCAIQNGAAKCWGLNTDGQLGIGTDQGFFATPQPVDTLSAGVTRISAGVTHSCAIQNGAATCWGYDGYAALGNGIVNDHKYSPDPVSGLGSGVVEITAGDDISCAVHGTSLLCWGADYSGDLGNGGGPRSLRALPTPVIGFSGRAGGAPAIGGTHVCAGTTDGALRCWGDDFVGSLGIGRVVISDGPLPVVRQDRLFADGYD